MKKESDSQDIKGLGLLRSFSTKFRQTIDWFKSGDLPPSTHKNSMRLMLFLNIFGITAFVCWFLSSYDIALQHVFPITWPVLGTSLLALLPGLYILFLTVMCWRRVPGYGWWMIPYVEQMF